MTAHDQLLDEWRLTKKITIQWTLVSTAGFVIFLAAFGWVFHVITGTAPDVTFTSGQGLDAFLSFAILILLFVGFIVPHELIHGAMMSWYGGNPRYGVGVAHFVLPYAYAVSDMEYARNQMLVILLAPLVGISLVGVGLMFVYPTPWLLVPLAGNAAGSVGDVWMAIRLLDYSPQVRVGETIDGIGVGVFGAESDVKPNSSAVYVWNAVLGSAGVFTILIIGLVVTMIGSLLLGIESVSIGDPDTIWHLLTVERDPDGLGASFEFGLPIMLVLSGIGGVGYAVFRGRASDT